MPSPSPYTPKPVPAWKYLALVLLWAGAITLCILLVKDIPPREQQGAAFTLRMASPIAAAFVLTIFLLTIGQVKNGLRSTLLVLLGVIGVSLSPAAGAAAGAGFGYVAVRPICRRLETQETRYNGISATSFTWLLGDGPLYLQCHYLSSKPSTAQVVPEGIPSSVPLPDARLAGPLLASTLVLGHQIALVAGFVLYYVLTGPGWGRWFRALRGAQR